MHIAGLTSVVRQPSDVQTKPFLSYGVLVVNLAVYMAGLGLRFSMGESSGEDYFYMLAKVNDEVVQGEYYRCALMHPSVCVSHEAPTAAVSTNLCYCKLVIGSIPWR